MSKLSNRIKFLKSITTGDLAAVLIGIGISAALFLFGINVPMETRLTGDAQEYLQIANQIENLNGALFYVGERSSGMPIFDWLFKPSNLNTPNAMNHWLTLICIALFAVHVFSSFLAARLARSLNLIKTRNGLRFLFIFLVSFPAFIGHTTTPLTDTISVDLTIINLAILFLSDKSTGLKAFFWAATAGLIAGYTCLLRPAYLIPTIMFVMVFTFLSLLGKKKAALGAIITFILLLGSVSHRCENIYGKLCLQNPQTFEAVYHAQMGLKGGRLLWGGPYISDEFPILPDSLMKTEYYDRCDLDRIVGTKTNSLIGCLLNRPQFIPAYILKKWIGLFDHFRFQPYMEDETPGWLKNLSRSYDALAWVGFLVALIAIFKGSFNINTLRNTRPIVLGYLLFVVLMLAEHTILHPEDRFGLVLIPVAGTGFVMFFEEILKAIKSHSWKRAIWAIATCALSIAIFVWQITTWDHGHF